MNSDSGNELEREIKKRGIKYIGCMIFLDKNDVVSSELNILQNGINHKVLFFVTEFPQKFCKKLIERNETNNVRIAVIKSEILYKEDCLRTYYDCHYRNKLSTGLTTRHNVQSFLNLFKSKVPLNYTANGSVNYLFRAKNKEANIPTHPGACIWWEGVVDVKYIVRLLDVETFIDLGPIIDDSLLEYIDHVEEDEFDNDGYTEEEIDKMLEQAAWRDMQFGTNEYEKLFNTFRKPRKNDEYYDNYYKDESEEDEPYYDLYWNDYEEYLSSGILD